MHMLYDSESFVVLHLRPDLKEGEEGAATELDQSRQLPRPLRLP